MSFSPDMINEDTIIRLANTLNETNFRALLKLLDDYYDNDESLISDKVYDELTDIYEAKYAIRHEVKAEIIGEKEELPYYMSGLRKIKEEKELELWLKQNVGEYIIMDKIDGLTLNYHNDVIDDTKHTKLFTKGRDGLKGKNVTHLLSYLNLPPSNDSIRSEIVMTKEVFKRVGKDYKNARNLASGIVNRKKNLELAYELSFYAYRIMNKVQTPQQDINDLKAQGFLVPYYILVSNPSELTVEFLRNYYNKRKDIAEYEMDGLVIYLNVAREYPSDEEPRHVIAFKTETESAITIVTNIIYTAGRDKALNPVVHYETVRLSGADLSKASGYNARYIVDNKIGPGAKILVSRSGDTIPDIISVISPSPNGPSYPDEKKHGPYEWNENHVEFVLIGENDEVIVARLKHFLKTIGVENVGRKRVEALVNAGIRNIDKLLTITPNQLITIPGIGSTLASQMYASIHNKIKNVPLARLMEASNIFEKVAEHRFQLILDIYPNLLDFANTDPKIVAERIREIKGFDTLADEVVYKLPQFTRWLKQHPQITIEGSYTNNTHTTATRTSTQQVQNKNLQGMTFVFSGFRDKDLQDRITKRGGRVTTSVSKNTTMLIMKDVNDLKGKGNDAKRLNVLIISKQDFIDRYLQY